jgi:hypothetical protein
MESSSNAGTDNANETSNGNNGNNGNTGNVSQLEQNIGSMPEQQYQQQEQEQEQEQEVINELKPIPIQPDERETPLINKGESARPPPTQPSPYQEQKSRNEEKQEAIQKALDYAEKHPQYPAPDDATSNTQSSKSKSGYCYIGEDRGFRSCIQVSPNVQCMSGEIFPSMDICVNPNLRA